MITSGQKERVVSVIVRDAQKTVQEEMEELCLAGVLNSSNFARISAYSNKIAAVVKAAIRTTLKELAEDIVGCVKLASGDRTIMVAGTNGKEKFQNRKDDVFYFIEDELKQLISMQEWKPTPATPVEVYRMVSDGSTHTIFGGFGEKLDRLGMEPGQIKEFVRSNRNDWLRTDKDRVLFLFRVGTEFFVAGVTSDSTSLSTGLLSLRCSRLSNTIVSRVDYEIYVVVPKQ